MGLLQWGDAAQRPVAADKPGASVQELGGKIGSVCPRKRSALGVHVESPIDFRVAERLEHVAAEFLFQVDLAGGAVAEAKPHGVATPVASLEEFRRTHDDRAHTAVSSSRTTAILFTETQPTRAVRLEAASRSVRSRSTTSTGSPSRRRSRSG